MKQLFGTLNEFDVELPNVLQQVPLAVWKNYFRYKPFIDHSSQALTAIEKLIDMFEESFSMDPYVNFINSTANHKAQKLD